MESNWKGLEKLLRRREVKSGMQPTMMPTSVSMMLEEAISGEILSACQKSIPGDQDRDRVPGLVRGVRK